MARFLSFTGKTAPAKIDADLVRRFLVDVAAGVDGAPTSAIYVESYRRGLAALFTWAVHEEWLKVSPMNKVAKVRVDVKAIDPLSEDEVRRLIACQPKTIAGIRNATMIAFMYDTGVRVGELVKIRIADVDLERGVAMVIGKGRREETVPLGLRLRRLLLAYLHRARPPRLFDDADDRLFLSRRGTPLTTFAVNQLLERAGRRAAIARRVHPHLFRHTFSTHYLRNGGDEFTLQKILRHRTATMTRRYVHMTMTDVEDRHAHASPLDRLGA